MIYERLNSTGHGYTKFLTLSNYFTFMFLNIFTIIYLYSKYNYINHKFKFILSIIGFLSYLNVLMYGNVVIFLKSLFISVLIVILRSISDKYNYQVIKTSEIEVGMVLSYFTVAKFLKSRIKGLPLTTTEDMKSRITDSEVESIRRWEHSKNGEETIVIVRKIPFACFISLGFILFILLGELIYV